MKTGTIRGSPVGMLGKLAQLFGLVQELLPPLMRSRNPCSTCPTAPPVWMATQFHGCALLQSDGAVAGHVNPGLMAYCGAQPCLISSRRFGRFGSQSTDWFWLPVTRMSTTGSLTAWATARLPATASFTTRSCVLPCSNEFTSPEPPSQTWTILVGPERAADAEKVRCTVPKVPLHLLPLGLQPFPWIVTLVSVTSHLSSTGSGPADGFTVK